MKHDLLPVAFFKTVHIPVMADEVVKLLSPQKGDAVIDCTVGEGGHAAFLIERVRNGGFLWGIDRDGEVLKVAAERLKESGSLKLICGNFAELERISEEEGMPSPDCILFDLGVSSFQLADPLRGFSFQKEGPLDMRMSRDTELTAGTIVNRSSVRELADIFRTFGEERAPERIAAAIVKARRIHPVKTTRELSGIIVMASGRRRSRIHPATLCFQALRIAVNRELEALGKGIEKAFGLLKGGGRLCVISFHSLEDRIVKNFFKGLVREGLAELLTPKPLRPAPAEVRANPRSRSARVRAVRKIGGTG